MKKRHIKFMENEGTRHLCLMPAFRSVRQEFRFRKLVLGDPVNERPGITDSLGLKIRKRKIN